MNKQIIKILKLSDNESMPLYPTFLIAGLTNNSELLYYFQTHRFKEVYYNFMKLKIQNEINDFIVEQYYTPEEYASLVLAKYNTDDLKQLENFLFSSSLSRYLFASILFLLENNKLSINDISSYFNLQTNNIFQLVLSKLLELDESSFFYKDIDFILKNALSESNSYFQYQDATLNALGKKLETQSISFDLKNSTFDFLTDKEFPTVSQKYFPIFAQKNILRTFYNYSPAYGPKSQINEESLNDDFQIDSIILNNLTDLCANDKVYTKQYDINIISPNDLTNPDLALFGFKNITSSDINQNQMSIQQFLVNMTNYMPDYKLLIFLKIYYGDTILIYLLDSKDVLTKLGLSEILDDTNLINNNKEHIFELFTEYINQKSKELVQNGIPVSISVLNTINSDGDIIFDKDGKSFIFPNYSYITYIKNDNQFITQISNADTLNIEEIKQKLKDETHLKLLNLTNEIKSKDILKQMNIDNFVENTIFRINELNLELLIKDKIKSSIYSEYLKFPLTEFEDIDSKFTIFFYNKYLYAIPKKVK